MYRMVKQTQTLWVLHTQSSIAVQNTNKTQSCTKYRTGHGNATNWQTRLFTITRSCAGLSLHNLK